MLLSSLTQHPHAPFAKWGVHAQSLSHVWLLPPECSPQGSSVHGILQARILEWTAISFSRGSSSLRNQIRVLSLLQWQTGSLPLAPPGKPQKRTGSVLSRAWAINHQAPLSVEFSRQEYWMVESLLFGRHSMASQSYRPTKDPYWCKPLFVWHTLESSSALSFSHTQYACIRCPVHCSLNASPECSSSPHMFCCYPGPGSRISHLNCCCWFLSSPCWWLTGAFPVCRALHWTLFSRVKVMSCPLPLTSCFLVQAHWAPGTPIFRYSLFFFFLSLFYF